MVGVHGVAQPVLRPVVVKGRRGVGPPPLAFAPGRVDCCGLPLSASAFHQGISPRTKSVTKAKIKHGIVATALADELWPVAAAASAT